MDEIAIYEQYATLERVSDRDQLLRNLIMSQSYDAETEMRSRNLVVELYYETMKLKYRIPTFTEVLGAVLTHNDDIFFNVAIMDFLREYDYTHMTESERTEQINEIADLLEYEAAMIETLDLDRYVSHVLEAYKLSYTCDSDDVIFDDIGAYDVVDCVTEKKGDVELLMHDCQNILLGGIFNRWFWYAI